MITHLRGTLHESYPNRAVVDVNGVGYEVNLPLSSYDALPGVGEGVRLLTHLQVREDEHALYGFVTEGERDLFRLLINQVSGIGPRMALSVLSGMRVERFKECVASGDVGALSKIKGVGKKTAERMVVELRDKVGVATAWEAAAAGAVEPRQAAASDAVLALITLGYKQVEAQRAVKECLGSGGAGEVNRDELLRGALRVLTG